MRRKRESRAIRVWEVDERIEKIVRQAIKKHRGKILKIEGRVFRVSFPSTLEARFCDVRIDQGILDGPPLVAHGGSGALGSAFPRSRAASPSPAEASSAEQRVVESIQRAREAMKREWDSWPFRGVQLSEEEEKLIRILLAGRGYSPLTPITPALEPFGLPPREYQNWLRDYLPDLKDHPGDLWPEIEGEALEILQQLEEYGVPRREVLAAVEMGPEDSQRLAAEILQSVQRDVEIRLKKLRPLLLLIKEVKPRLEQARRDLVTHFDFTLWSDVDVLKGIDSVVTKYLETPHVRNLLRRKHTSVIQERIQRLGNLLVARLGVRGKKGKPYAFTARFLSAYRRDLFEGLTTAKVRSRLKDRNRKTTPPET